MTRVHRITRRRALKITAGAAGATLPLVHVQSANAAGKLTMGVWDHWVPAANPVLKGLIEHHARYTESRRAREILADWAKHRARFVKVFPKEYRRALGENAAASRKAVA